MKVLYFLGHRKQWFKFLLLLGLIVNLYKPSQGQDLCVPVGWGTVGGTITGGGAATPITVTTYDDLETQLTATTAKVIYVSGTIVIPSGGQISGQSNKTLIGLPGARLRALDQTSANSGTLRFASKTN